MLGPFKFYFVLDPTVVYGCVVDLHHHLRRISDGGFDMQEYFDRPQLYESVFAKEVCN